MYIPRTVRVLSFDIWKTLLNGNKAFTRPRLQLIFDMLGVEITDMETVVAAYRASDKFYNDAMEHAGTDFGFLPRLTHMFRTLDISSDLLPDAVRVAQIQNAVGVLRCRPEFLPPFTEPDLVETLSRLRRHYKLVLLSNTGMDDHSVMEPVLQTLGLWNLFSEAVFTSDPTIVFAKPNRRVFLRMAGRIGAHPNEILHIGDNSNADCLGATRADMYAVLYAPDGPPEGNSYPFITSMKQLLQPALVTC